MSDNAEQAFRDAEEMAAARERFVDITNRLGLENASTSALPGESPLAYRIRLATRLRPHTASFKDAPLHKADEPLFNVMEASVYQEADHRANNLPIQPGKLRMVESRDRGGREVLTPSSDSDPRVWMEPFSAGAIYYGKIRGH